MTGSERGPAMTTDAREMLELAEHEKALFELLRSILSDVATRRLGVLSSRANDALHKLKHVTTLRTASERLAADDMQTQLVDAGKAALALADDAIALANDWDDRLWDLPGRRVMAADLADLYRRREALAALPAREMKR